MGWSERGGVEAGRAARAEVGSALLLVAYSHILGSSGFCFHLAMKPNTELSTELSVTKNQSQNRKQ